MTCSEGSVGSICDIHCSNVCILHMYTKKESIVLLKSVTLFNVHVEHVRTTC